MDKPKSAKFSDKHWIVKRHKGKKVVETAPFRIYFLHPSLESAQTEAKRLADSFPGVKFSIYEKVETLQTILPETKDVP